MHFLKVHLSGLIFLKIEKQLQYTISLEYLYIITHRFTNNKYLLVYSSSYFFKYESKAK
jgi:hypothetical protein